jgi:UTP--glucose-1-phosphate uridylyltransferase
MLGAAVPTAAIEVFAHYYGQLQAGATGLISEDSIEPLVDPPQLDQLQVDPHAAAEALAHTAIIKLNGGLGTSSPVRSGRPAPPSGCGRHCC